MGACLEDGLQKLTSSSLWSDHFFVVAFFSQQFQI
jgi:hypothetical protein